MRKILLLGAALLCAVSAFSKPRTFDPLAEALAALASDRGASELGSMTVADVEKAVARLSVAMQQEAWIHGSAMASRALPGLGQFLNRDPLGGSLYLAGSAAVTAGTLVGAYFLLPDDVQAGWFTSSIGTLEANFRSHSVVQYLPSLGVMAAGAVIDAVLRCVSASGAARLAERRVLDGTVSFEPVLISSGKGVGLGVRFKPKP
jgi:stage V sporulation protein SpoVS